MYHYCMVISLLLLIPSAAYPGVKKQSELTLRAHDTCWKKYQTLTKLQTTTQSCHTFCTCVQKLCKIDQAEDDFCNKKLHALNNKKCDVQSILEICDKTELKPLITQNAHIKVTTTTKPRPWKDYRLTHEPFVRIVYRSKSEMVEITEKFLKRARSFHQTSVLQPTATGGNFTTPNVTLAGMILPAVLTNTSFESSEIQSVRKTRYRMDNANWTVFLTRHYNGSNKLLVTRGPKPNRIKL